MVASGIHEGEEVVMNGVFKIDAAAQLAGKPSMMNPEGGKVSTGHDHGNMEMDEEMSVKEEKEVTHTFKHEMIKVYGNCEMCKDRIETAAGEVNGVKSAMWDTESKMLHLEYYPEITSIMDVEKAIAAVGHDTENQTAPDNVYSELPGCCLYDRPGKN